MAARQIEWVLFSCAHRYPRAVPLFWSSRTLQQCQSSLSTAESVKTHPAVGRFSARLRNIFTGVKVITLGPSHRGPRGWDHAADVVSNKAAAGGVNIKTHVHIFWRRNNIGADIYLHIYNTYVLLWQAARSSVSQQNLLLRNEWNGNCSQSVRL